MGANQSCCTGREGQSAELTDLYSPGPPAYAGQGGPQKKSSKSVGPGANKNAAAGKSRASTSSQFPVTFQALQTGTETEDAAGEPSSEVIRASMDQVQKEVAYNQSYYPGRFDEYNERASAARMTSAQGGSGAAQPMSGIVTQLAEQSYASYGPSNPGDEPGSPNPKYAKAGSAAVPATAPAATRAGPTASGMPDVGTNRLPSGYGNMMHAQAVGKSVGGPGNPGAGLNMAAMMQQNQGMLQRQREKARANEVTYGGAGQNLNYQSPPTGPQRGPGSGQQGSFSGGPEPGTEEYEEQERKKKVERMRKMAEKQAYGMGAAGPTKMLDGFGDVKLKKRTEG